MFKKILIAFAVVLAAILIYAATKPGTFRVARTASIQAPPEVIYAILSDYRQWPAWSPYDKLDPAIQRTYSGADKGVGAVYAWEGDKKVGSGRMEITEVSEPSRVVMRLDFFKPFKATNTVTFTLEPQAGGATSVTWAMEGQAPYIHKLIGVFCNLDKLIGKDFETGLANLKALAEK